MSISQAALQVAIGQLGKQEVPKGSNWGKDVQKYLNSVGIDFPAAWCAAFVYWCVKQVATPHPMIKTGGVLRQWNEIPKQYKFDKPFTGAIFIMDFGKGLGHTGFVESIVGDTINTIEGNATNESGTREGYIVCRKQRKISGCKGFVYLG